MTPGERQTLLHRRNEEFSTKKRKTGSESSQEDISVINSDTEVTEPLKHPEVMINGNSNFLCNTTTFQKKKNNVQISLIVYFNFVSS